MRTFKAAFREVYEKGLMKYGFRKVKGRHPYYARCIGSEIVHVITYWEDPGVWNRDFVVLFGAATVYRKKITFDEPTKDGREWLSELSTICYRENYYPAHDRKAYKEMIPFRFEYVGVDEDSMMEEIEKSFELTEKYAIPVLDSIKTLEDCMKHFFKYYPSLLWIKAASDAYVLEWLGDA